MNVGQTHSSSFTEETVSSEPQVVDSDLRGEKCGQKNRSLKLQEQLSVPSTGYCGNDSEMKKLNPKKNKKPGQWCIQVLCG